MTRRSIVIALVLATVGTTAGVALAALRSSSPDVILEAAPVAAPVDPVAPPDGGVARIDALPGIGPIDISVPSKPGKSTAGQSSSPSSSFDVAGVQRRLTELKYYVGPINGNAGGATRSAVSAFQKVHGLGADGSIGPATLAALANPRTPSLRGGPARRVEVDLGRQVLFYVEGGQLARIVPISSGNGAAYRQKDGGEARSLTPVGTFRIERTISGVREADLGTLYDPMYFYQGWAIHGSNSVPAYPASHGCIRVTRADAVWLFGRLPIGSAVIIYGGSHTFVPGSGAPGTTTPAGDRAGEVPLVSEEDESEDRRTPPQPSVPRRPEPNPSEQDIAKPDDRHGPDASGPPEDSGTE